MTRKNYGKIIFYSAAISFFFYRKATTKSLYSVQETISLKYKKSDDFEKKYDRHVVATVT